MVGAKRPKKKKRKKRGNVRERKTVFLRSPA